MYQKILKDSGLKATHQRLAILDEIERFGHVQMETLFETLHTLYPTLALGTLYRNISELKAKYIIKEVQVDNQKVYYETIKAQHQHFICKECHDVQDVMIDSDTINAQFSKSVQIDRVDIAIYGICKKCKEDINE